MTSQNASYFINAAMGWPILPTSDMPGGGPAYPLSALGVRGRILPTDSLTILGGVFNGSPVADNTGDPQARNPSGTSFPLNGGVLAIAELQYAIGSPDPSARGADPHSLPGTYKVGFWYDSEKFADLRFDKAGLPLASLASAGVAASHGGNYGFYGVVDQMVYRFQDESGHNLNVFVRPMFTPLDDRNLISYAVNGGVTLHEPFAGRSDDVAGLGFGYARISAAASRFDQDKAFFNPGAYNPVRHSETFIEATYQFQATPWWQVQPDFQYVFDPGAGILNPNAPSQKVRNEAVIGVRTNITF
jgi:porin